MGIIGSLLGGLGPALGALIAVIALLIVWGIHKARNRKPKEKPVPKTPGLSGDQEKNPPPDPIPPPDPPPPQVKKESLLKRVLKYPFRKAKALYGFSSTEAKELYNKLRSLKVELTVTPKKKIYDIASDKKISLTAQASGGSNDYVYTWDINGKGKQTVLAQNQAYVVDLVTLAATKKGFPQKHRIYVRADDKVYGIHGYNNFRFKIINSNDTDPVEREGFFKRVKEKIRGFRIRKGLRVKILSIPENKHEYISGGREDRVITVVAQVE